jgi:hypothetical protein
MHNVQGDKQWRPMLQLRRNGPVSRVPGYRPPEARPNAIANLQAYSKPVTHAAVRVHHQLELPPAAGTPDRAKVVALQGHIAAEFLQRRTRLNALKDSILNVGSQPFDEIEHTGCLSQFHWPGESDAFSAHWINRREGSYPAAFSPTTSIVSKYGASCSRCTIAVSSF